MTVKIAATGFVDDNGGSVTSANALLLRGLLDAGYEVHFFSKPSFVDPRPSAQGRPNLIFHDTTNFAADNFRRRVSKIPILNQLAVRLDASTYEKLLVTRMMQAQKKENFALCLWLGAYASGRVPGLPSLSYTQGPPGTDARSLIERQEEIAALAGKKTAQKWALLARIRLSKGGLPDFSSSDHFIVGSKQASDRLHKTYGIERNKFSSLPYPIDLEAFRLPDPLKGESPEPNGTDVLKVLWLGRIVPRKRLDLFLNGCKAAIDRGVPVQITIVGQTAMIPEYEKLIERFPFKERLLWRRHMPRTEVPALMWTQDVLAQPSDEENFGSSVAEAQACGMPVIVGHTNGNADYLCPRSIHLADDSPETFADALETLYNRKRNGDWGDPAVSRSTAEKFFAPDNVVKQFLKILNAAM